MSEYEDSLHSKQEEIAYLKRTIEKLQKQAFLNFIYSFIGVAIIIFSLSYLIKNPDVVSGSLSMLFIGILVIVYNLLVRKSKLTRASQLSQDLKKEEECLNDKDIRF